MKEKRRQRIERRKIREGMFYFRNVLISYSAPSNQKKKKKKLSKLSFGQWLHKKHSTLTVNKYTSQRNLTGKKFQSTIRGKFAWLIRVYRVRTHGFKILMSEISQMKLSQL